VLLFFPPIPPDVRGSLWSYLASTAAVILGALEIRALTPALVARWARVREERRWIASLAIAVGLLGFAFVLRAAAPDLFDRYSREEGVWEPITLFCYLGSLLLLWRTGSGLSGAPRKHLRLVAGAYALLVLEEVDYSGIFGGLIGPIEGVDVGGALHELLIVYLFYRALAVLQPWLVAVVLAVAAWGLWWTGYLQPRVWFQTIASSRIVWVVLGLGFLFAAAAEESGLLGIRFGRPSPEEAIELAGAVCFAVFALQTAAHAMTRAQVRDEPLA
jgi:hypothetical protein